MKKIYFMLAIAGIFAGCVPSANSATKIQVQIALLHLKMLSCKKSIKMMCVILSEKKNVGSRC